MLVGKKYRKYVRDVEVIPCELLRRDLWQLQGIQQGRKRAVGQISPFSAGGLAELVQ